MFEFMVFRFLFALVWLIQALSESNVSAWRQIFQSYCATPDTDPGRRVEPGELALFLRQEKAQGHVEHDYCGLAQQPTKLGGEILDELRKREWPGWVIARPVWFEATHVHAELVLTAAPPK